MQPIVVVPPAEIDRLRKSLGQAGFRGDIGSDQALRAAMSTDNSIYVITPDLVVAPRDADDVVRFLEVMASPGFEAIAVTARGGGTGTNGQSLNTGVIVDFQKHMNRLLAVNVDEQWADVEPGIVLDELNGKLAQHGLFFAPTTSTASRCTIGGMVSTDASGKGSRLYGKTSDNVLGLHMVLEGGQLLDSAMDAPDTVRRMLADVEAACRAGRDALLSRTPNLSRRFTGYDLERATPPDEPLEWWRLPIGAEGTLGLVTRIRVKLTPKPRFKRLVVIGFVDFASALDAGKALLAEEPLAIEVMDEWVQGLANKAGILDRLPAALREQGDRPVAYNFVELVGDDETVLAAQLERLGTLAQSLPGVIASHIARDDIEMGALWNVRAASVGLLGKVSGRRRPIAFVEDCVVPVENLAPFVDEFGALLQKHGLSYGMYGHVDVGCLHIRPALDMDDVTDQAIMKQVSDGVFALTKKHGGIFWGEHGKGVRGAYLSEFVGETAYAAFMQIKHAFDPHLRFNPGKLVGDLDRLMGIATTPLRPVNVPDDDPLAMAFRCNGNAQCMSYQRSTPMCPSFKATRDVRHSPKGRADALRLWHKASRDGTVSAAMEEDVRQALDGCLGCKACATACPVQVDIPEMKSHFLEVFHRSNKRRLADHFALQLEEQSPLLLRFRRLLAVSAAVVTPAVGRLLGMRDLPLLQASGAKEAGYRVLPAGEIAARDWPEGTVFIWQDPFTALFDTEAQLAMADGLTALGYSPIFVTLLPAGKAAHVLGDRSRFLRQARRLRAAIDAVATRRRPMIGIDPAFVMMLRQEYAKAGLSGEKVLLVQEMLQHAILSGRQWPELKAQAMPAKLFGHCSETAGSNNAIAAWKPVFVALGLPIEVQSSGCCGMAGLYGHQQQHQKVSRKIFDLSWQAALQGEATAMVTGFSCRCQAERFSSTTVAHPMRWIADAAA